MMHYGGFGLFSGLLTLLLIALVILGIVALVRYLGHQTDQFGRFGGGSMGDARCLTSPAANAPFRPPKQKSTATRRSRIRSSGRIPVPGANACTSCATTAPRSRASIRRKLRR